MAFNIMVIKKLEAYTYGNQRLFYIFLSKERVSMGYTLYKFNVHFTISYYDTYHP